MKQINFGIIGCGDVTEKKSGPAFQKLAGSNLYAVMRRNEDKLKDYAHRHGIERYSTNYLDLLEDPTINAIYVATPPHKHCFYTKEAAKHGKAVYVEKPMALTVSECREMIQVCERYNVPLFVAYYRREHEKFKRIAEIINSDTLGHIRSFNYEYSSPGISNLNPSWVLNRKVSGGGLLFDIGSHMIDTILYLLGDVKEAFGISSNQSNPLDVNDNTSAMIKFKNGVQGTMQLTFNANIYQDEIAIVGERGTIIFSIMSNDPVILHTKNGSEEITFDEIEHVQLPLIKRVIDTLLGKDDLNADGQDGLRTQEILEVLDNSESISYE